MNYQPVGEPETIEDPNATMAATEVGFTGPDVETDELAMRAQVYDSLRTRAPGWEPHDGNLEVWLTEDYTSIAAEIRSLCASVPEAIFKTYGEEVLGIPPRLPAPAMGHVTIRAVDDQGYSLQPGAELIVRRTGDELIAFELVSGAIVERGERQVEEVDIVALAPGRAGNGLTGEAELAEAFSWIESVTLTHHTFGGDDGQGEEEYLADLSQLMRVIAIRPILPADYAIIALRTLGVGRAIAMDGYEPTTKTWGHQRLVTLVVTDEYGDPVHPDIKAALRAELERLREVNFRVYVIDPTYQNVNVDYEVTVFAEQNEQMVESLCESALFDYLSPARWRLGMTSPSIAAGEVILPPREGRQPSHQTVRRNDLVGLLDRMRGVDWVDDVKINGASADVDLTGPMTLPRLGQLKAKVNGQ